MSGLSPADALRTHVEAGWTKTHVEEQVLLLAFAEEDTRKAQGGYVSWDGVEYYDDALLPLTGQTVIVRVSRHDPRYAFVFDEARTLICAAGVAPVFGFLDPAGAVEQARRKKELMRYVAELRVNCCRLDLVKEMRQVVAAPHEAKRLSQWSPANEIDPLLVDVFADEEGAETVPGRTESAI